MVRLILLLLLAVPALAQTTIRDPAEGQPGNPVPLFATGIAGKDDSSNLRMLHVDNSGNLNFVAAASLYNGSAFENDYANWHTTTGDSGTKIATFNGATQTNFNSRGALVTVILGTVSGTSPTLACQLQFSPDAGTTWITYGPALANLTATSQTGTILIYPSGWQQSLQNGGTGAGIATGSTVTLAMNSPLPRTWRILHTIAGTNPSFALTSEQIQYIR